MGDHRDNPRFGIQIEIHVQIGLRQLATTTREISRTGLFFFASLPPATEERVRVTLFPEDLATFSVAGTIKYHLPGVGAGVLFDRNDRRFMSYQTFVNQVQCSSQIADSLPRDTRTVEQREMLPLGRSCAALRLLFQREPPVPPEGLFDDSRASKRNIDCLNGVSRSPLTLKLGEKDRAHNLYVGVRQDGSFVALLPLARGRYVLYNLRGREQIVVRSNERSVYPEYSAEELEHIRQDALPLFRSRKKKPISSPAMAIPWSTPAAMEKGSPTDDLPPMPLQRFSNWRIFDQTARADLIALLDELDTESHIFEVGGIERSVRLLQSARVLVKPAATNTYTGGVLFHDGQRFLVVLKQEQTAKKLIRALVPTDEIKVLWMNES